MSLEKILTKIESVKALAMTDLNTVDPRALPYKKGKVDAAKRKLEDLYVDYKKEMMNRCIFILVTGKDSGEFVKIANEEAGCFETHGKQFFKEVADQIDPQLYLKKNSNSSLFDVVNNIMEDKMKALDIISYPRIMFSAKYSKTLQSQQDLIDLLQRAIADSIGNEVVGMDALERIAKVAVNEGYKKALVPVIIHSKDENFIMELSKSLRNINPKVVRVAAGRTLTDVNALLTIDEVSTEEVGKALKTIADKA